MEEIRNEKDILHLPKGNIEKKSSEFNLLEFIESEIKNEEKKSKKKNTKSKEMIKLNWEKYFTKLLKYQSLFCEYQDQVGNEVSTLVSTFETERKKQKVNWKEDFAVLEENFKRIEEMIIPEIFKLKDENTSMVSSECAKLLKDVPQFISQKSQELLQIREKVGKKVEQIKGKIKESDEDKKKRMNEIIALFNQKTDDFNKQLSIKEEKTTPEVSEILKFE